MIHQEHLAIDGYVDAPPTPGACPGTASFDLIHSPADRRAPNAPDAVFACTSCDPRIVDALLREIQPGDLLRVTGAVVYPDTASACFTIDALEILQAVPAPMPPDLVLERRSGYVAIYSTTHDTVPIFTTDGTWVGSATSPDTVAAVIQAHQSGNSQ